MAYLRDQVKTCRARSSTRPILDLYPAGSTRGEGAAVQTVPADARLFTVVLNPAGRPAFEQYALEIVDGDGDEVGGYGGLAPNPYGSFSATLSRDLLGSGDFRVRLVGIDPGGGREIVEEYALRIRRPSPPPPLPRTPGPPGERESAGQHLPVRAFDGATELEKPLGLETRVTRSPLPGSGCAGGMG